MKRFVLVLMAVITPAVLLAGCASESSHATTKNEDPRKGWVAKFDNADGASRVWYRCDDKGTGYYMAWSNGGGVDVVPNSPDCLPR